MRGVSAVATGPGAIVPIAYAHHGASALPPLGLIPGGPMPLSLAGMALSAIVVGFLLLTAISYRRPRGSAKTASRLPWTPPAAQPERATEARASSTSRGASPKVRSVSVESMMNGRSHW